MEAAQVAARPRPAIGNDVVDLEHAHARAKARDERFLRRIFTADEATWIHSSPDPERTLWMLWAAKEAAFKVVSKQGGSLLFAHRAYEVQPPPQSELTEDATSVRGSVKVLTAQGQEVPVEWEVSERLVHCLAASDAALFPSVRSAVGTFDPAAMPSTADWSERELLSARSAESCEARLLAKRLAREVGLGAVEVVRNPDARRPGPPQLYPAGEADPIEEWDLTLSHDGVYVAAALARRDSGSTD